MASSSENRITTVLLDTNILIYSATEPFDVVHQLRAVGLTHIKVPLAVMDELMRISSTGPSRKLRRFARLALEIAKGLETVEFEFKDVPTDDQLARAAKDGRYIIATTDAALRRRLAGEGLSVIFLKNGRLIPETDLVTRI